MAASSLAVQPAQTQPRRKKFIPNYNVEGVYIIDIGEETQTQIEMVVGHDISAQYPWKMVPTSKIIETIETGGELSDFFSIKEKLEEYPGESVLMGYIVDESKDTDEFYVCCTEEARNHCKEQSDRFIRRQEKKLDKAVKKKPRPWTCLGSDKEIKSLQPVNTRPLMEVEVRASFPTLYDPKKFYVRDTNSVRDGVIELTPYRQKFNNIYRRRVDTGVQAAAAKVDKEAQTMLRYPKNMWTQSIADALGMVTDVEGGGDAGRPKGISVDWESASSESGDDKGEKEPLDEVGVAAYRAALKRMRRPSYIKMIDHFVTQKQSEIESIIELNTVMDMYSNDYPKLITHKMVDKYDSMKFEEYLCFTDVRAKNKYVSSAVFHPMMTGIVAISYADGSPSVMKFLSTRSDPIQRAVYGLNPVMIWSHVDSLMPKLYMESPREVKVLSFCPFDENILIGGCVNGQIVVWDLTHKLENVEKLEVLSETREKYRIAMNAHMGWMKNVQDNAVVQATVLSNLMTSHYGPVTAIEWLSPNFIVTPTGKITRMPYGKKSVQLFTGSEDGTILIWNLSVENVTLFENKKVKKSKRITRRPSGLTVDISPFKILDRILQPCYKIILGIAGQPYTLSLQSLGMTWPKLEYINVSRNLGSGRKYFICEVLPQEEKDINTILYCGSQHGELRRITWEGHEFNTGESVNSEYCDMAYSCCIHDGIITATLKNPHLTDLVATVGGKVFALWLDKFKGKPVFWKKRPYRLTDAQWSFNKASRLFVSTSEGTLEVWDLLLRSDEPISIQTMSGTMLTGVSLHLLPISRNIVGVSDVSGSFRMFLVPPIFMLKNASYHDRFETNMKRELRVMKEFIVWQDNWVKNNPHILLEMKRKEGALLLEKEEEKRHLKQEEEKRLEEEAEARRIVRMRVVGPEERWQKIIQKLIERTIAVKKRINRAELIEHEKPLRELEMQRLEKERRMLEIMKNQKSIFNDTVAILFPEAIKKEEKVKKSLLSEDKDGLKRDYLANYENLKKSAYKQVKDNPYKVEFSWDATVAEGKDRRAALNAHVDYVNMHRQRIDEDFREPKEQSSESVGIGKLNVGSQETVDKSGV